ncbi:MAG: dTDP-4-dehydrorhamnose 3,5-epimerase family protein [Flavobacteriaceae bacterium]
MKRFDIIDTELAEVKIVKRNLIGDNRGHLSRIFCRNELEQANWNEDISQINHTYTQERGTIRGLHFQHPPHAEIKMVSCLRGSIWDVVVDLRENSATFLNWCAVNLSAANLQALIIPKGFAHGFQTLEKDVELLYFHSAEYSKSAEDGLNPLDPSLDISWPLNIEQISDRDMNHKYIDSGFSGIKI